MRGQLLPYADQRIQRPVPYFASMYVQCGELCPSMLDALNMYTAQPMDDAKHGHCRRRHETEVKRRAGTCETLVSRP